VAAARKLQREISSLDNRLKREPQFNRKVELRAELRSCKAELDALLSPGNMTPESAV